MLVVSEKIGTGKKSRNRYPKNLVPEKSPGTGIGKIWYRKKVSEPVSDKFGTGTYFRRQNLGILKIYKGYRYRIGAGTGKFSFFQVVSENFGTGKSLGTGIGKIWYRKKVSEPVSEKFGTGKSLGTGIGNFFVPKLIFVAKI